MKRKKTNFMYLLLIPAFLLGVSGFAQKTAPKLQSTGLSKVHVEQKTPGGDLANKVHSVLKKAQAKTSAAPRTRQAPVNMASDNEVLPAGFHPVAAASAVPYKPVQTDAPLGILFDQSSLITHPTSGAGGAPVSALQSSLLMTSYGSNWASSYPFRLADDFTNSVTWNIDSIVFFGYQTNSTTTSTFTSVNFQIWNGDPSAGGTVVFGDLTTNRMTATRWSGIYRALETTLTNTARPIMRIVCATPGLVLSPGTYWWDAQAAGTLSSGPWMPPVTILGQTTTGNAMQHDAGWLPVQDGGTLTNLGMPFIIYGSSTTLAHDISPISLIAPVSNPALGAAEPVTVRIFNYGTSPESNFPVSYQIDGGTIVTENVTATIAPNTSYDYTFAQTADLTAPNSVFQFTLQTHLAGDLNPANDILNTSVSNILSYCTFAVSGNDCSSLYEYIDAVNFGSINNVSGCVSTAHGYTDFTALSTDMIQGIGIPITVNIGNYYSSDSVGVFVDFNHNGLFTDAGEFIHLTVDDALEIATGTITCPYGSFVGATRMRVVLVYSQVPVPCGAPAYGDAEDYTVNLIAPYPFDAGVTGITSPVAGNCAYTAAETVAVNVMNFGANAFGSVLVSYDVNGVPTGSGVLAQTLNPGDAATFTFGTPLDLSVPGVYTLTAYTSLLGDGNPGNDAFTKVITVPDMPVEVHINPIALGTDIAAWGIWDYNTNDWAAMGQTTGNTPYVGNACVLSTGCYDFIITNANGAGASPIAGWELWLGGNVVASNAAWAGGDNYAINFTGGCPPSPDLAVAVVYTLGELPVEAGAPHVVQAIIGNYGNIPLTDVPVTLNITGANTFTDVFTIPIINPLEGMTITFNGFTPAVLGHNTVTVSLPTNFFGFPDVDPTDNAFSYYQDVTPNTFAYSDTSDVITSWSYGAPGLWIMKLHETGIKVVDQVNVFVSDATSIGHELYGVVLNAAGNVIAQGPNVAIGALGWVNLPIPLCPALLNEEFYAGVGQVWDGNAYYPISCQGEYPMRPGAFYIADPDGSNLADFYELLPQIAYDQIYRYIFEVEMADPVVTTAATLNTCPGIVTVPVTVQRLNNVAAISLDLDFDAANLSFVTLSDINPAFNPADFLFTGSNGEVLVSWTSTTPASPGTGLLFNAVFQTNNMTPTNLDWDVAVGNNEYMDIDERIMPSYFVNGVVTPINCSDVLGNVKYDNYNTPSHPSYSPMTNTWIYLKLGGVKVDSAQSNASGDFLFHNVGNGSYTMDGKTAKAWGGVNTNDALRVLQHFNGNLLTGIRFQTARVNGNSYANANDALSIAKRFVGLITHFTITDWQFEHPVVNVTGAGNVTQNLMAQCAGDVNGSYTTIPNTKTTPYVTLATLGQKYVNGAATVDIPLSVNKDMTVGAVSLVLNHSLAVEVSGVTVKGNSGNLLFNDQNGELRISWFDNAPLQLAGGDVLLTLTVKMNNAENLFFEAGSESVLGNELADNIENVTLTMPKLVNTSGPAEVSLSNFPNPFSKTTLIRYDLPEAGHVTLKVMNALGAEVATLVNDAQDMGTYSVTFDGSNLSHGVYVCRLEVNHSVKNIMMVVSE